MSMRPRLLLVLALVACRREQKLAVPAESATARPTPVPVAFAFDAPAVWDDRVKLEEEVPGTGTYRLARMFTYTPKDTTVVPQALLGIFVYDSAAWAAVAAESGPPMGDSLTTAHGQVFIAALPQSNPFREGSPDFRAFDSLSVSLEQVKRGFRVPR